MSESEEFLGFTPDRSATIPSEVPIRRKLILVFSVWVVALLIACPDPRAFTLIPLFPFGLFGLICAMKGMQQAESVILILGWLIYAAMTITALVMRRRKRFYFFWAILTTLLLLNAAGCHAVLSGLSNIH